MRAVRSGAPRLRAKMVATCLAVLAAGGILAACGSSNAKSSSSNSTSTGSTKPTSGGNITVLANTAELDWTSLDPASSKSYGVDIPYLDAIYGGLFLESAADKVVPDLATGYKLLNNATELEIFLRHGVTFQDGTPFNAAAVKFNISRDLEPSFACGCAANFPVKSITTPNNYTVDLQLSQPDAAIIQAFIDEQPNSIISPTALQKMGEKQFALTPVGAGPFKVVSDSYNATLKLEKYSGYWQKGHPYLDSITFKGIANDSSGYDALISGEAQAYIGLSTFALVKTISKKFKVTPLANTQTYVIQLNTNHAPFNNIEARKAIYYATDAAAIDKSIANGTYPLSESPTGPAGLFYEPKVPGYLPYDPAKAKAIVKQLGGLSVTLGTINLSQDTDITAELKAQWAQVGINATIGAYDINALVQYMEKGKWDSMLQSVGSVDPASFFGPAFRFASGGNFSGLHSKTVDKYLAEGKTTVGKAARAKIYHDLFAYMAKEAFAPFLFAAPIYYTVTKPPLAADGLTKPDVDVFWQDASI